MRKLLFSITLLLCIQQLAYSQKEWSNWFYNRDLALTFKNGYPENVTNYIQNPPPVPPWTNMFHFYHWGQGGISYSDRLTGDMKFIVSMKLGFDRTFNDFPNDTFLRSCTPDQETYRIIPFGNNPDKFYVVQFQSAVHDLTAQETGLQVRCPNAVGLAYSIADLSLNGGLGDFSTVNNIITSNLTDQICLVKHADGQSVWVIVHPYNTAQFKAYLFTGTGVQAPVTSTIGVMINGGSNTARGTLAASPDGKLLAGCRGLVNVSGGQSGIELFDFNNATGVLTNYRTMPSQDNVWDLCFSPDNSKLYASGFRNVYPYPGLLYQWDFNNPNVSASRTLISESNNSSYYDMQLAPDGKIYLNNYSYNDANGDYHRFLSVVRCPNLPKYSSNFKLDGFEILWGVAFPFLVNDHVIQPPAIPPPVFSIGNDTAVCTWPLTLTAPAGWQSYQWNTGETTQSITVNSSGTYYVLTGNTGFSCPEAYGYINVADAAQKLNLGPDSLLCPAAPYQLSIPSAYSNITWNNGSHTRDSIILGSGTIIISATDMNGCSTNDTLIISRKQYPRASFGADTTLCGNSTLLLQMEPVASPLFNATYLWQNNSSLDTFRVTQPGMYWGTVTFQGCTARDTINVQYISTENFSLGSDTSLCSGDALVITAPVANASYSWNTGATSQSITVYNSGQYHVAVTNGYCVIRDTVQVNFVTRPVLSLGNDTALCEGNTLILQTGLSGGSYLWQNGSNQSTFNVNSPGLYHVQYSYGGCTVSDSINISYLTKPPVDLGIDRNFCEGGQVMLNASHPQVQSYLWQDQSALPSFPVTSGGTYFVRVIGNNGCINSDTVNIEMVTPAAVYLGTDTSICEGSRLTLSANLPGTQLLWNTGSTNNSIQVSQAGIYWLEATKQGCISRDSVTIGINSIPQFNLGADTSLCEGNSLTLQAASSNSTYTWQDGSTTAQHTVTVPGLYHVSVTNSNGCTKSDSIRVNFLPLPFVTLGRDTLICPGQSFELQPKTNTEVTYSWQDGSSSPSFNVRDTGTFTLRVENICGSSTSAVVVRKGICQLYIPNSFTPNDDNLNDLFRIKYPFQVKHFQMAVYNRYGEQVFLSGDINRGWNGKFKGILQSGGVYVWTITFTDIDGINKNMQGTVLLLR